MERETVPACIQTHRDAENVQTQASPPTKPSKMEHVWIGMDVGANGHKWVLVKVFTGEKCYPQLLCIFLKCIWDAFIQWNDTLMLLDFLCQETLVRIFLLFPMSHSWNEGLCRFCCLFVHIDFRPQKSELYRHIVLRNTVTNVVYQTRFHYFWEVTNEVQKAHIRTTLPRCQSNLPDAYPIFHHKQYYNVAFCLRNSTNQNSGHFCDTQTVF